MHPHRPAPLRLAAAALLALLAAADLHAQGVRGRVVDAETGEPVAGAIVTLTDASGARHAEALAGADGAYALRVPAAGAYELRAERVGYASASVAAELTGEETAERRIALAPRIVVLRPLIARGARRACTVRPQNGPEAAILWDEARKALSSAEVGRRGRRYAYQARIVRREISLPGRRVVDSAVHVTGGYGTHLFRAAPVERLAEHGYVEEGPDSIAFHAPDAATLLSEVFLDHHCFSVREGTGAEYGLAGLEFAPLRGRGLPDVRGVLWLDAETGRLRHVEYAYTGLPYRAATDELGGRVEFEQMEDGGWIVRRWMVRMPRLVTDGRTGAMTVRSLVEHEGVVTAVRPVR